MQVQNLIRSSADVITISTVHAGDVYKRVVKKSYSEDVELRFGVVQSLMNNGTDGAFTALECVVDYSAVTVEVKTFTAGADLSIFAATPDEYRAHLDKVLESAQRNVKDAENTLAAKQVLLERVAGVIASASTLTSPATSTAITVD